MKEARHGLDGRKFALMRVRKRDGRDAEFLIAHASKQAIEKAFRSELNLAVVEPLPNDIYQDILAIVEQVIELAMDAKRLEPLNVEQIQDIVEIGLMQRQHFKVARPLHSLSHRTCEITSCSTCGTRHRRRTKTACRGGSKVEIEPGVRVRFDASRIRHFLASLPESHAAEIDCEELIDEVIKGSFSG